MIFYRANVNCGCLLSHIKLFHTIFFFAVVTSICGRNVMSLQVGEEVEVSMQDPEVMFSVVEVGIDEEFACLPGEVKVKLSEALKNI